MAEITLEAVTGRAVGSAESGRLRIAGRIPAVVYGHGISPMSVSVDARELRGALTGGAGLNTLLSLQVDGKAHLAMAKAVQRHPVRNTVTHVDFIVVSRDEIVTADVPLILVGEPASPEVGLVEQLLTVLSVQAKPASLPHAIEIDQTAFIPGQIVRIGDLQLPDGVTATHDADEVVVKVEGVEEPVADEAADTGDAGAES
jgi:large subunit ribosomal protein L25